MDLRPAVSVNTPGRGVTARCDRHRSPANDSVIERSERRGTLNAVTFAAAFSLIRSWRPRTRFHAKEWCQRNDEDERRPDFHGETRTLTI